MDIFKFAMDKEKFAEDYYRQLADKTGNERLKHICNMLADEEVKHYETVQKMQSASVKEIADSPILKDSRRIFESMRKSTEQFDLDISEVELYEKARDIERESREFYLSKAEEMDDPGHKDIFRKLANEEQKHYVLVDKICAFVARPQWFLENAEMYRFDDYAEGVL
jgi:rubrerythrin